MEREFHLGDILSVTTERLVSPTNMTGLRSLMEFVTGEDLATAGLFFMADPVKAELLDQHPWLAEIEAPARFDSAAHVDRWLAEQVRTYGELHLVRAFG